MFIIVSFEGEEKEVCVTLIFEQVWYNQLKDRNSAHFADLEKGLGQAVSWPLKAVVKCRKMLNVLTTIEQFRIPSYC